VLVLSSFHCAVRKVFECCYESPFVVFLSNRQFDGTNAMLPHNAILTMRIIDKCSDDHRFFEIKFDRAVCSSHSHCATHVIVPTAQFNFEHSFNLCLDSLLMSFLWIWITCVIDTVQHQISRLFAQMGFDFEKVDFGKMIEDHAVKEKNGAFCEGPQTSDAAASVVAKLTNEHQLQNAIMQPQHPMP